METLLPFRVVKAKCEAVKFTAAEDLLNKYMVKTRPKVSWLGAVVCGFGSGDTDITLARCKSL